MPLVSPFTSSASTQLRRDVLLVSAVGPDAEGWGECVAMHEPLYTSEYVEAAEDVIRRHLVPRLWAADRWAGSDVAPALAAVKGHRMAKAALELAVLDAELHRTGTPLGGYLGATRPAVQAGVAVGIVGSLPELIDQVDAYVSEGYGRIKLKIEPGWDVEPVRAVRERFGPDLGLQVDANATYTPTDADHLRRLDEFGLLLIEQPLDEEDLLGHAELARRLRTPICLDESITSVAVARTAISVGACSIINIKPGRLGGILEARRVHDLCASRSIPVWCGGMLETGVGRAANVALAALPNFTLPGDLSASARYYEPDITTPFELVDGFVAVPTRPGIGVEIDMALVDALTSSRSVLTRS